MAKEETLKNQLCPIHSGNAFFLTIRHCIFCSTFWANQLGKTNIAVANHIAIPLLHTTAKGVIRNIENIVGILFNQALIIGSDFCLHIWSCPLYGKTKINRIHGLRSRTFQTACSAKKSTPSRSSCIKRNEPLWNKHFHFWDE